MSESGRVSRQIPVGAKPKPLIVPEIRSNTTLRRQITGIMGDMDLELLIVRDCPYAAAAVQLLRTALDDIGLPDKDFDTTMVVGQGDADRRRFNGSPAFFVDGTDLFREAGHSAGLSCRLYRTSDRVGGLPDLVDLRRALKRAADRPRPVQR